MTRKEYFWLKDKLEAFTQRKIQNLLVTTFLLITCVFSFFLMLFAFEFAVDWMIAFKIVASMLLCTSAFIFGQRVEYKENNFKIIVKLGDAWENKKTIEEVLAMPEFKEFFPQKRKMPENPGMEETH